MKSTQLDMYIGVPMPAVLSLKEASETEQCRIALYDALDELVGQSGLLDFPVGNGVVTPELRLLNEDETTAFATSRLLSEDCLRCCEILAVSAIVPHALFDQPSSLHAGIDPDHLAQVVARTELAKRISDLLVLANVSRLGALAVLESVVVQDETPREFSPVPRMTALSLQLAAITAAHMTWPPLAPVALQDVWGWYLKRRNALDGFDGTSVGRALCAFSRLFEHKTQDEPMQMLWALTGLEALYCQGKSELGQQLRDKAQAFLGKQVAFKKVLTKMYDFRSRFVHGAMDFPGLYLMADARDAVTEFDDELSEAISVAIALLAATLQEIIRRDWDGLVFDYVVSNSSVRAT